MRWLRSASGGPSGEDTLTWQCPDCGNTFVTETPRACPNCGHADPDPVEVEVPGAEDGEVRTDAFDVDAATADLRSRKRAADGTEDADQRPSLLSRLLGLLR